MSFSDYNNEPEYIDRYTFESSISSIHSHLNRIQNQINGVGSLVYSLKPGIGWFMSIVIAVVLNVVIFNIPENSKYEGYISKLEYYENVVFSKMFVDDRLPSDYSISENFSDSLIFKYLTPYQFGAVNYKIIQNESLSAGGYKAFSNFCYAGAHQFGAAMLKDLGYIKSSNFNKQTRATKRGRGKHCEFMKNENNWTIPGGLQTFLNSPEIQDTAFIRMIEGHLRTARRNGILNDSTPAHIVGGIISSSQFGIGRTIDWYKLGLEYKDGNKTKVSKYANDGELAVKYAKETDIQYLPSVMASQTVSNNVNKQNDITEKLLDLFR